MDKALKIGEVSATGSFQLFIGKTISTIILAIGSIILARLMAPAEYGVYAIALIPSVTISLFHDWGINPAMTKYIAQYRAMGKDENIRDIIATGLTFQVATGLVLSLFSLFLANFIATTIFIRPETAPLISIASIAILSNSLLTVSQSNFTGFERMKLTSFTLICQSIIQSTATPLLVLIGYGAIGAILGYTMSFLVAGIIGVTMLYFLLFKNSKKFNPRRTDKIKTLKTMVRYGVPLSISTILTSFLIQFYAFLMAFYCSDVMIGNYQIATNFALILTFFTFPVGTVLFPAFAKLDPKNEHHLLKNVFTSSVKYTALLVVPATMAVMTLSKPMISTLFGEKWVYAPFFLTLYVINNLFVVFGNIIKGSLLTGLGETKMLMKLSLLTLSIGLPLALLLIPTLGIVGVILGSIFAGLPSMFLGLHWIWKRYEAKADFKSSTKISVASAIAAIITYVSLSFLNVADWIELLTGGTVFLVAYVLAAPVIGAINQSEINNLRAMLSGLGMVSKLINIPLIIAEKTLQIYYNAKKE